MHIHAYSLITVDTYLPFFDNIDNNSILIPMSSPPPMSSYDSFVLAQQFQKTAQKDNLMVNVAPDQTIISGY